MEVKHKVSKYVSILLGIMTVVSLGFGFYSYFHEKKPYISYSIINDVNVFDINKKVQDLKVLFKDTDLSQFNLKIYTIRMQNNGEAGVNQDDYDRNDNWGIGIDSGKIVEIRLSDFGSEYVKNYINPKLIDNRRIFFDKIILDRNDYFDIDILVLEDLDVSPKFYHFGKISGIQDDDMSIPEVEKQNQSFLEKAFYGGIFVMFTRFIFDVVILLIVIIIVAIFVSFASSLTLKHRQKKLNKYFQENNVLRNNIDDLISYLYVNRGFGVLKESVKNMSSGRVFDNIIIPHLPNSFASLYESIRVNENVRNDFLQKANNLIKFVE